MEWLRMLRAGALLSWATGRGFCANPGTAHRSTGQNGPLRSADQVMPAQHTLLCVPHSGPPLGPRSVLVSL